TTFDILHGIVVSSWIVVKSKIRIAHARSYPPALIVLVLKKLFRIDFLFDMRGFYADERVDGGLWPVDGKLYRVAKWLQQRFLLYADCVVSLTHAGVHEMKRWPYLQGRMPRFEVITTCTDLNLFKPMSDARKRVTNPPFTLLYL